MPYVDKEVRVLLDEYLNPLIDRLSQQRSGAVNYTITRILLGYFTSATYFTFVVVLGTLACIGLEYYRRVAAPFEDAKREEHGDVY